VSVIYEAPSLAPSIVRELELLAPRSDQISWLHASWRPDWGRWCVWQMIPPAGVPTTLWGPDTQVISRVETLLGRRMIRLAPDPRFKLILNRKMMTRWAWELHLETGCYPQPFWVVQGSQGGHKWSFTDEEERLAAMKGFPVEPPEPGALPYAPLDRRVLAKIAVYDQLPYWNMLSRGLNELDERDLDRREAEMMQRANRQLWNWLDSQVDRAVEESGVALASDPAGGYRDSDAGYEEAEEAFINSTD
jgi:hypothetical protein